MNCIVVDDDKSSRTALKELISQVDFLNLKEECSDPVKAFNYLKREKVDLVFLDVEMPGMSGIELIRNLEVRPVIILISAKKDYAVEAFELNLADYITKPITLSRFMLAVSKAKILFEQKDEHHQLVDHQKDKDYIFVRANSVLTKIRINDIVYIQALGDYVNIFSTGKRYTVHITLKGIEEKLPKGRFYRLHRSYLVSLDHIEGIEESTAYAGTFPLPIGEALKKELLIKLNLI
jgi:two-component system LytT family response regulator